MQSKLKRILKSSTDFVHVVSGHKGVTNDGFELTKKAAVVSLRNRHEFGK